jgi:LysM repeat protein
MKLHAHLLATFGAALLYGAAYGQTLAPTPNRSGGATDLQALAKKIDEQNAKIDMLSQQILKLQMQISNMRPGVMIGEGAPATTAAPTNAPDASRAPANGNTHIVARGETLTSIAKLHGVSVGDLQKANRIDNPLKLQAGQTLLIPSSSSPAPSGSPGD